MMNTFLRVEAKASRYGMTLQNLQELISFQDCACAICGAEFPRRSILVDSKLVIDHCHNKGHVRGLLCNKCNTGIGFFRDDPNMLRDAIDYLEADNAATLRNKWRREAQEAAEIAAKKVAAVLKETRSPQQPATGDQVETTTERKN